MVIRDTATCCVNSLHLPVIRANFSIARSAVSSGTMRLGDDVLTSERKIHSSVHSDGALDSAGAGEKSIDRFEFELTPCAL